jgi:Fe-S-cluster-containing dehydrogenase component
MARNGLLIDYEYCTGCHTCEIACQVEFNIPIGKWGIKLAEIGPFQISEDKWEYTYVPIPTNLCNLCEERVAKGKQPTCVQHCQANVMKCGPVEELVKDMQEKSHLVLFAPR